MKKLVIILGLCLFYTPIQAKEITPEQSISNEQAYFTANLQKQEKPERQKIGNHFSFFTINIQITKSQQNKNGI